MNLGLASALVAGLLLFESDKANVSQLGVMLVAGSLTQAAAKGG